MFAAKDALTAEEETPYLERFIVALLTHNNDNGKGADDGRGSPNRQSTTTTTTTTTTLVADLLGRHARATTVGGVGGVLVIKFMAK